MQPERVVNLTGTKHPRSWSDLTEGREVLLPLAIWNYHDPDWVTATVRQVVQLERKAKKPINGDPDKTRVVVESVPVAEIHVCDRIPTVWVHKLSILRLYPTTD